MGIFELTMRDGIQLFSIDYNVLDDNKIKNKIKAIKLVIKSSFGGNKTYINQIMFYENTIQEITAMETSQSRNSFQQEINLPEDLSNSQISLEESNQKNLNINNKIKKINKNSGKNKKIDDNYNGNKIKKHNIIDFISETNSKASEITDNNRAKIREKENIKIEENNINFKKAKIKINNDDYSLEKNENEEIENTNIENYEGNKVLTTSEGFHNSYMEQKSISSKNEEENENYHNKKVQKLEKILKQKILKNDNINNNINRDEIFFQNYNQNKTQDYEENQLNKKNNFLRDDRNNNMNNFQNLTPIVKNSYYNVNRRNMNLYNNSERESNYEENSDKNNTIQKYFQINANTQGRFTDKGYNYLMEKKRYATPKMSDIYLNQNEKKLRNKTLQNFGKSKLNKTSIDGNRAYETLEYQLNDMEQHLQKMALNSDMILQKENNNNNSKIAREENDFNNNINLNRNNNPINNINNIQSNNSMMSNMTNNYLNDELRNQMNNTNNYQFINNNNEETKDINERIDNLEKNIFSIREELNNISSGLKLFLDKEYFLYNFKDTIKQICYNFFSEKMDNNQQRNNENLESNENEEQDYSQYNSDFNESKNNRNNPNISKKEKLGIEDRINKKIDEKLEYLCDNLKNQIFEKYLQPSIKEIENSMKQNIEDIKEKVDSMNYSNLNNINNEDMSKKYFNNDINGERDDKEENGEENFSSNNNYENSLRNNSNTSKVQKNKYEEINRLGVKLYGKLMEKEKKLRLLKQETTKLLNGKNIDNNFSNK